MFASLTSAPNRDRIWHLKITIAAVAAYSALVLSNFRGRCLNRSLVIVPTAWLLIISVDKSQRASLNPLKCVCILNAVLVEHSEQVLLLSIHCSIHSSQPTTRWQQGLVTGLRITPLQITHCEDIHKPRFFIQPGNDTKHLIQLIYSLCDASRHGPDEL